MTKTDVDAPARLAGLGGDGAAALAASLARIADALERLAPPPAPPPDFSAAGAFVWRPQETSRGAGGAGDRFAAVPQVARIDLDLLVGVDRARDTLLANTQRFARGLPANNALLWGARGMGKSSLVKAVHAAVRAASETEPTVAETGLVLIEILREDLPTLDRALAAMRATPARRFLLFCDDLSFEKDDAHYKALKAALDGGVEGRPENTLFYATSNRRHLMPRDMIENERQRGVNPTEAVEEKVSLSDRFGLWLGFHACGQDDFLAMINRYVAAFGLDVDAETVRREAIEWRQTRGAASGRVAWQYVQDLAGRLGRPLVR